MTTTRAPLPAFAAPARWVYLACVALFAAGVVVQVTFAGLAVLVNPSYWPMHFISGHSVGLFTIGAALTALVGRLSARLLILTALLFLLFGFQYVFVNTLNGVSGGVFRAFHAVNALALFWLATHLTGRAWQLLRPRRIENASTAEPVGETVRGFGG